MAVRLSWHTCWMPPESDRRILEKKIERQRAEVDQLQLEVDTWRVINLYLNTLRGASGTILKKLGFIREE